MTPSTLLLLWRVPAQLRLVRAAGIAACGLLLVCASARAAPPVPWPVAGEQGLVRLVIVPVDSARERDAYAQQVALLCPPDRTCFLNFYTNSTGAALVLPLPDAIDHEATATYRRSTKQGAERFMWSCRMKMVGEPCF